MQGIRSNEHKGPFVTCVAVGSPQTGAMLGPKQKPCDHALRHKVAHTGVTAIRITPLAEDDPL